jgi:hypothetical protein
MRTILFALLFAITAFAEVTPLTLPQFEVEKELKAEPNLTWTYDLSQVGKYATGYLGPSAEGPQAQATNFKFGERKLKSMDLADFGAELSPVLNQANCGSCVVFAVLSAWTDTMRVRGMVFEPLSPQHLMNCGGNAGQCSGDYGDRVSARLVKLATLHTNKAYPYTARSARCTEDSVEGDRYGKIKSYKTIDGSTESLLASITDGHAVAIGVAADGKFSSYKSGVYNPSSFSMGTNHYVVGQAIDCESSVDAQGYCVFDEDGELPPNVGTILVRNSWSKNYGNNGYILMKLTDKRGRRINNIAGGRDNAQIYDIGIPVVPPGPSKFVMESADMILNVELKDAAVSREQARAGLQRVLDFIRGK